MVKYGIIGLLSLLAAIIFNTEDRPFALSKNSASIKISGTSNFHDWTMNVKTFDCSAVFVLKESQLKAVDKVAFSCNATDLKCDNSMMENKAYAALKSRVFPEIRFRMTSPVKLSSNENNFSGNLGGDLVVAGKSGDVTTGTLNPSLVGYNFFSQTYTPYYIGRELAFYRKAGYDKQINDDLRVRATLSGYHASNNHFGSLYFGDRKQVIRMANQCQTL